MFMVMYSTLGVTLLCRFVCISTCPKRDSSLGLQVTIYSNLIISSKPLGHHGLFLFLCYYNSVKLRCEIERGKWWFYILSHLFLELWTGALLNLNKQRTQNTNREDNSFTLFIKIMQREYNSVLRTFLKLWTQLTENWLNLPLDTRTGAILTNTRATKLTCPSTPEFEISCHGNTFN